MKVHFLIPVYNDKKSLIKLIKSICEKYNKYFISFLIINDGSNEVFEDLKDQFKPNIFEIINLKSNQGNQKSISIGIKYLQEEKKEFDYLIIMDADGEDDPRYIENLILKAKENDDQKVIFASRLKRNEGIVFNFFYFFYKLIFYILTGSKINFGNFSCIPNQIFSNIANIPTISLHYSASILNSKLSYETYPSNKGIRYDSISRMNISNFIMHAMKSFSIYYEKILIRILSFTLGGFLISIFFIILVVINKYFAKFVLIGWSSDMVLGLFIISIIFLFMFFSSLLLLLNRSNYKEYLEKDIDYKFYVKNIIS